MRTVLVAVKPIVLNRQFRQVPILDSGRFDITLFYEGEIQTMRDFPAGIWPLTVVVWDSDHLPKEIRESSLEAGLVLKLYDIFIWNCKAEYAFNEEFGHKKAKGVLC